MSEYICLHGDCDNYALSQEGCFAVQDEDGRTWLCYQPDDIVREVGKVKAEVKQMQAKAYELGFATGGTHLSAVMGMELEILPEWLAET